MKKSKIWLLVWLILGIVGTTFSKVYEVGNFLNTGMRLSHPYPTMVLTALLAFVVLCMVVPASISLYYAIREKAKRVKAIDVFLLCHHSICIILISQEILGK